MIKKKRLFGKSISVMDGDEKYSRMVSVPQYLPRNVKPQIESLTDCKKYFELLRNIEMSEVTENEKNFLRLAACRHIVFNYDLIADYYSHATPEMQELMEQSALVILDIDDAIMNGYVKLSERLKAIREDGKLAKKARDFK